MLLYHKLILIVLLYGAKIWSLKIKTSSLLSVFERKILRIIKGPLKLVHGLNKMPNMGLSCRKNGANITSKKSLLQ